ncbi:MAG TPA: glycoside hydrolase family 3 N-terminal domain-containing protein, partial [Candidatus Dormibacteraeota bacterium]|nr:glycoside hydrolase family 3 N-terminal domain-containing protein [Candidatus Dormibacteraeota bacterium]
MTGRAMGLEAQRDGGAPSAAPAKAIELDAARRLAGCRVLRTYEGLEPTPEVLEAIGDGRASGVTLFRRKNIGSPAELLTACDALQAARPEADPPLVIGLDQEGGQLQAVGHGATAWPGNLALGATGSEELAEAAGRAIGTEAAAVGATLVFAPVCDVLQPMSATPLGTRPFGSDPQVVARLAAAMTRGLRSAGVLAVLKHFPGHGAAAGDSHIAMPTIRDSAAVIRERDLPPFVAGIAAGAQAVLPGHLAAPALTDGRVESATISTSLLRGLLRDELAFEGVTISDAMDMGGAGGEARLEATSVAAAGAGMDLLLLIHAPEVEDGVVDALAEAIASGRLDATEAREARERILRVRRSLDPASRPPLDVVGCEAHTELALRIAAASVTLVADPQALLPIRTSEVTRVALVAPVPVDLTPAETSSYVRLGLAEALRHHGLVVDELVAPLDPSPAEAAALAD